jgi:hypothetical protein
MGTRSNRYAVLAAGALLGSALLTGCGGDEKPSPPPTGGGTVAGGPTTAPPTSDPSGTTTPSDPATSSSPRPTKGTEEAGAPGVPKAARQHTNKGAEAFARHYLQQINATGLEPETGRLEPLARATCKSCANYAERAATLKARDQHYSGQIFDLGSSHVIPGVDPKVIRVRVKVTQRATKVVNRQGGVVKEIASQDGALRLDIAWTHEGWRVAKIYVIVNS